MNNQFKNKIVECGTTPKFNKGLFFCVAANTTLVALEDCPEDGLTKEQTKRTSREDIIEVASQRCQYEYEEQLIHRQDEIIKALEKQISEAEQELYEKDKEIERLKNDLEEVCEELFLEVNLR